MGEIFGVRIYSPLKDMIPPNPPFLETPFSVEVPNASAVQFSTCSVSTDQWRF